jgi:DNA-binding XRE family transcriptional regulator
MRTRRWAVVAKRSQFSAARKAAGYTQESLAEAVGVDRSTVVRWEAGETAPQPWARPKLATMLGISSLELAAVLDRRERADAHLEESGIDVAASGLISRPGRTRV